MKLRYLLAASALCLPFTAANAAEGISYNYAEASYQVWTDSKAHSWALKGSYQVADQAYLVAEDNYYFGMRSGGVGFFLPIEDNLHAYGQIALGDSNDGIRPILEGGARFALNDQLELRGALRYVADAYGKNSAGSDFNFDLDFDDDDDWGGNGDKDEIFIQLEALYKLDSRIGFTGALTIPSEADGVVLNLGARFSF